MPLNSSGNREKLAQKRAFAREESGLSHDAYKSILPAENPRVKGANPCCEIAT